MLVQAAAGASSWTDTTAVAGTAYEYKFVLKYHGLPVASTTNSLAFVGTNSPEPVGFIIAGVGVDKTGGRGRVVVREGDPSETLGRSRPKSRFPAGKRTEKKQNRQKRTF